MLRSVFPRTHQKYFSLPLLGPITDGFDDWLTASGFTQGSRKLAIHLLPIADKQLRRRGVDEVAKLNHAVLDDCCKALKKRYPCRAGTIHTLERYLVANGLIVDGRQAAATQPSSLSGEYAGHLREVRGFATSTVSSHRRTAQCFLQHLAAAGTALRRIRPCHVESYVAQAGKLNPILNGWCTYFGVGNSNRTFHKVDWAVRSEVQLWLRRKHRCPWRTAKKRWGYRFLHDRCRLYQMVGKVSHLEGLRRTPPDEDDRRAGCGKTARPVR